jgi:hypothetical protein
MKPHYHLFALSFILTLDKYLSTNFTPNAPGGVAGGGGSGVAV